MGGQLRLGFHYHITAQRRADGLYVPAYFGRFLDGLAERCEKLTCFLHSPGRDDHTIDYRLRSSNVSFADLGSKGSVPRRELLGKRYAEPLRLERAALDAVLLRGPTPLLPAMARAAQPLPVALLLVGDYVQSVPDLAQPLWRKALIQSWAIWNRHQQRSIVRRSLTIVNNVALGEALRPVARRLVETRTTTLEKADLFAREDTCASPPYHLLSVGRISRGKRLEDIVEALTRLRERGLEVVLDVVGWADEGDDALERARAVARARGVTEHFRYHGFFPVGEQLYRFYRKADVFVAASTGEGFPRTIWEAMAHSVPVVTTSVGSIPIMVGNAALTVEPRSPDQLADAIQRLIETPELRRSVIRAGFALASNNTLEKQLTEMVSHIEDWVRDQA